VLFEDMNWGGTWNCSSGSGDVKSDSRGSTVCRLLLCDTRVPVWCVLPRCCCPMRKSVLASTNRSHNGVISRAALALHQVVVQLTAAHAHVSSVVLAGKLSGVPRQRCDLAMPGLVAVLLSSAAPEQAEIQRSSTMCEQCQANNSNRLAHLAAHCTGNAMWLVDARPLSNADHTIHQRRLQQHRCAISIHVQASQPGIIRHKVFCYWSDVSGLNSDTLCRTDPSFVGVA